MVGLHEWLVGKLVDLLSQSLSMSASVDENDGRSVRTNGIENLSGKRGVLLKGLRGGLLLFGGRLL